MGVVPPFEMVAVNVTVVPSQITFPGDTLTAQVAAGEAVRFIVTVLDVAGEFRIQVSLDVMIHVTRSPFSRALVT